MVSTLFTQSELGKKAGLSESCTRNYLHRYRPFFHAEQQNGRQKLYGKTALKTLKFIRNKYAQGWTKAEILDALHQKHQAPIPEIVEKISPITLEDLHAQQLKIIAMIQTQYPAKKPRRILNSLF